MSRTVTFSFDVWCLFYVYNSLLYLTFLTVITFYFVSGLYIVFPALTSHNNNNNDNYCSNFHYNIADNGMLTLA